MSFALEEKNGDATLLRQQVQVRIGPIGKWLNRREFEAVQQHMKEEGDNLKRMMEA